MIMFKRTVRYKTDNRMRISKIWLYGSLLDDDAKSFGDVNCFFEAEWEAEPDTLDSVIFITDISPSESLCENDRKAVIVSRIINERPDSDPMTCGFEGFGRLKRTGQECALIWKNGRLLDVWERHSRHPHSWGDAPFRGEDIRTDQGVLKFHNPVLDDYLFPDFGMT